MTDTHSQSDRLYAEPRVKVEDFRFDATVASVFDDMINRSVPGYELIIANTGLLAAHFAQPGRVLYDLGCSLGATTAAMRRELKNTETPIIAIDNSMAMLDRARERLQGEPSITFQLADLREVPIQNACVVAMNFTLQFVPANERLEVLQRIRAGLVPGGALLLAEKIITTDAMDESMHIAFKRSRGYSDLEVAQKRAALENVMVPESAAVHEHRLRQAGFSVVRCWFHCFNWMAWYAVTAPA